MEGKGINKIVVVLVLSMIVSVFTSHTSYADVPHKINYQGYLTDSSGTPIDGTMSMTFSLYDAVTGSTSLWSEVQNVTVTNGIYSVNLGDFNPINLLFDAQYYLGVSVGVDAEMTPR